MTNPAAPRLTSLSHGGGCGCKIAPGILTQLLSNMPPATGFENLLIGIETADDAAVYKLNEDQALVATTDFFMPIVDDPYEFGRIAATNALSDIYAMGASPIMALAITGMPINVLTSSDIARILQGGADVCTQAGIPIAGGHSIDCVEPIYGLAAMGLVHPDQVRSNAQARPGDVLILGKALGVGVLSAALKKESLPDAAYKSLIHSTTTLNRPGAELAKIPGVHAMTDITGFGLLGHVLEMARASEVVAHINSSAIPWLPMAMEFAQQGVVTGASGRNWHSYGQDVFLPDPVPQYLQDLLCDPQTSGGLLIACNTVVAEKVLEVFHRHGMDSAACIGHIEPFAGHSPHVQVFT